MEGPVIETEIQTPSGELLRFWLLAVPPDFSSPFRVTVSRPVNLESSIADQELRRPTAEAIRWRQEFSAVVTGRNAVVLEEWLASMGDETVAVPLWPAMIGADQARSAFSAAYWVAISSGFDRSEVFRDSDQVPGWCGEDDMIAPLVFGYLESRTLQMLTSTVAAFRVAHTERSASELAVSPAGHAFPIGPRHSAADPFHLFHGVVHFEGPTQSAKIELERADIGFGRSPEMRALAGPSREFSASVPIHSPEEFSRFIAFWAAHTSAVPFWLSAPMDRFTLARDISPGEVVIPASGHSVTPGEWIGFQDWQRCGFARVGAVGADWLRLESPPGDFAAADTLATRLCLTRFRTDRLSIEVRSPGHADASLDLRELLPESEGEAWAVPGVNIGAAAPRVWLYQIQSGEDSEFWTSHESPVVCRGQLWSPGRINHGERTASVNGSRDSISLQVGLSSSRLVRDAIGRRITGRLRISVIEGELCGSSVNDPVAVFSGDANSVALSGVTVTLSCQPWPELSTLRVPRFRIQPGCNHVLFRGGCGLVESDWRWTAVIEDPGVPGFPFTFVLSGFDGPDEVTAANHFAGGWIETATDKVPVRASSAAEDGAITVTLARDPRPFPRTGQSVGVFPGCDGRYETCAAKFNNRDNFGGHPFVPAANPSLVKLSSAINGGKK